MLTNFIPKSSLKSPYGKTYVVRATIKSPLRISILQYIFPYHLAKDSPLREGTVGYTFSKEYQQTLQQIALRSKEETKGANLLFSADVCEVNPCFIISHYY
jgi:hypothetical protein